MLGLWSSMWLHAQPASKPLRVSLGLSGMSYVGDFTQNDGGFWRVQPGFNIGVQFDGPRRWQAQLRAGLSRVVEQADRGRISGAVDPLTGRMVQPNQFVDDSLFFLEARLRVKLIKRGPVQPYLGAGLGLLFFAPRDQQRNELSLNPNTRLSGENYGNTTPSFPLMVGSDIRLHDLIGLGLMYTFRPLATDLFDNLAALGPRPGNDQLHELTLSLHVYLQGPALEARQPEPAQPTPDSLPPVVAAAQPDLAQYLVYESGYLPRSDRRVEPLHFDEPTAQPIPPEAVPVTVPHNMLLAEAAAYFSLPEAALQALNQPLPELLPQGMRLFLPPSNMDH